MTTIKQQVLRAIEEVGDDPAGVRCWYIPISNRRERNDFVYWNPESAPDAIECSVDELPERKYGSGYGGVEGEPFIGFSKRYVYVRGVYDGSEWIEAIPISPETWDGKSFPEIGGG